MDNTDSRRITGVVVDLFNRVLIPGEVVMEDGRIARIIPGKNIGGPFILPGLVDAHVHVESSLLSPARFAEASVRGGTVAVVADPHEVANVAGPDGMIALMEHAAALPFHFCFGAPSCVPASDQDACHQPFDPPLIEHLLAREDIFFLGEMMNFPGVLRGDAAVSAVLAAARALGKPVDGHAPGLRGAEGARYFRAGIDTDHECISLDEAREKIGYGVKILIREGSAARNYRSLAPLIAEHPDQVMWCTDDCHPDELLQGPIISLVRRAVADGYDLFDVLRAASLNPVAHYGLKTGLLRPGDSADCIVVDNLRDFTVQATFIRGRQVYDGRTTVFSGLSGTLDAVYPFRTARDADLRVRRGQGRVRVIGVLPGEIVTESRLLPLWGEGTLLESDPARDIAKIVLLNRYQDDPPVIAFIQGLGLRKGAFGASIAHDSHHILAAGVEDEAIGACLRFIVEHRGGLCVAEGGETSGLALPLFGLMTDAPAEEAAASYGRLNSRVQALGSPLDAPFMTLSFMALSVIPALKLNHRGLFDVDRFCSTALFAAE
ncbi:MAG: adenine deaminase [Desulfobulbus sp.]|jgi:adenine deaminase